MLKIILFVICVSFECDNVYYGYLISLWKMSWAAKTILGEGVIFSAQTFLKVIGR